MAYVSDGMLVVLYLVIFALLMVNLLFTSKFPMLFKLLRAKRIVWKILADGSLIPVPAVQAGIAYKTADDEYFEYEREDVVLFGKIPGILAYAPYSRSLNPEAVTVLSYLKKVGVNDIYTYRKILNAREMTYEEYQQAMKDSATESRMRAEAAARASRGKSNRGVNTGYVEDEEETGEEEDQEEDDT